MGTLEYMPTPIRLTIIFIIIFGCVYIGFAMLLMNFPIEEKTARNICITVSLIMATGALFFGGDTSPLLHDQYN